MSLWALDAFSCPANGWDTAFRSITECVCRPINIYWEDGWDTEAHGYKKAMYIFRMQPFGRPGGTE